MLVSSVYATYSVLWLWWLVYLFVWPYVCNVGGNDCTYSIKSAFWKSGPPPCPSDVPAPLRVVTIVKVGCFAKFCVNKIDCKLNDLRWLRSTNSRSQISAPINRGGVEDPRLEAKAKDTKKIRGQGQEQPLRGQTLSRPRTGMLEAKDQGHKRKCSPKKKKKVFTKIFQAISTKNVFQKIFQALHEILTIQKIVLSSSRGQANFWGLEASRPRPRTSKWALEDVLEAKDVLEDSTSAF